MKAFHASAPGRVNLIGEHTDYNGGFVLPTPIPQTTQVALLPRKDQRVRVKSTLTQSSPQPVEFTLGQEKRGLGWVDYIQGITYLLRLEKMDHPGFDLEIDSKVPIGSGLSSSAALEVAIFRALRDAFAFPIDDVTIARLGQRVENEFVGARIGIMDQMAASVGRLGEALFLDTWDLSYRRIPLPLDRVNLVVIHSGISHSNVQGDYNQRRAQCEEACRLLGLGLLRELGIEDLTRIKGHLPDVVFKRVRHVVTENQRVLDAVSALESENWARLGQLFLQSHASMRDDYEVSIPEIDLLVKIAASENGVWGARLTGGGFGGSIVALCEPGRAQQIAKRILDQYRERSSHHGMAIVA